MTAHPSLDLMATFAAVVRCGGFTAAARELGMSKQAVSEQVGKLEENLGVRLLERTTRRVRTTEVGERFYARCAIVVEQAEQARRELQDGLAEPTGRLRVACTVIFGEMCLGDVVAQFLLDWPRVAVDLVLSDRPVDLLADGYDVAFWFERPDDTSFHARAIGPALTYWVAHPSYLERYGDLESPERLAGVRRIEWNSQGWPAATRTPPVLTVNSPRAALTAVLREVGIAHLPSILIEDDVRAGNLVLLFDGTPAVSTEVHAIYPSGRFLPPKVRCFIELAAQKVEPMRRLEETPRRRRARRRG